MKMKLYSLPCSYQAPNCLGNLQFIVCCSNPECQKLRKKEYNKAWYAQNKGYYKKYNYHYRRKQFDKLPRISTKTNKSTKIHVIKGVV